MRRWMLVLVPLILAPSIAMAEPQRIEDPEPSCDNLENTDKPPCKPDSEKPRTPGPTPAERDGVIVPPDIPAEGLPHQNKEPPTDDGSINPE
jgi:hypothetical protein